MKKVIYYVLFIVLLVFVVAFSTQNAQETQVDFLIWNFKMSLSLMLFIAFFIGSIFALLFITPLLFRNKSSKQEPPETASEKDSKENTP